MLTPENREFLIGVARDTWRYFDTFGGPDDHGLPPDNVQVAPDWTISGILAATPATSRPNRSRT